MILLIIIHEQKLKSYINAFIYFTEFLIWYKLLQILILQILINLTNYVNSIAKLRLSVCKSQTNLWAVSLNPCCNSIDGAARHLIHKLPGEHCSPENSRSASTNTSSVTRTRTLIAIPRKSSLKYFSRINFEKDT